MNWDILVCENVTVSFYCDLLMLKEHFFTLEVFHNFQKTWMIASTTNLFVLGCFLQVQLVDFLMFIMFSKFYKVPALPGESIGYICSIFLIKCEFVNVVQSYQTPTFNESYGHNFMERPYISLPKSSLKKIFFRHLTWLHFSLNLNSTSRFFLICYYFFNSLENLNQSRCDSPQKTRTKIGQLWHKKKQIGVSKKIETHMRDICTKIMEAHKIFVRHSHKEK